jgi:DNA-binding CsgD family transcriptional regulator
MKNRCNIENLEYDKSMDKQKQIREAAQWLLIKQTLRPLSEIAEEAGMSVNKLKYHAKRLLKEEKPK